MASLCLPMTSKNQQMNQILVPISPKKKILLRKNRLKSPPKIIKTIQIQMRTIRTTIQIKNWKMMIHEDKQEKNGNSTREKNRRETKDNNSHNNDTSNSSESLHSALSTILG